MLGTNDGIASVAGIVVGVAGAGTSKGPIFSADLAGLVAGAGKPPRPLSPIHALPNAEPFGNTPAPYRHLWKPVRQACASVRRFLGIPGSLWLAASFCWDAPRYWLPSERHKQRAQRKDRTTPGCFWEPG